MFLHAKFLVKAAGRSGALKQRVGVAACTATSTATSTARQSSPAVLFSRSYGVVAAEVPVVASADPSETMKTAPTTSSTTPRSQSHSSRADGTTSTIKLDDLADALAQRSNLASPSAISALLARVENGGALALRPDDWEQLLIATAEGLSPSTSSSSSPGKRDGNKNGRARYLQVAAVERVAEEARKALAERALRPTFGMQVALMEVYGAVGNRVKVEAVYEEIASASGGTRLTRQNKLHLVQNLSLVGSLKALELLNSLVPSTNSGRRQDKADSAAAATTADEATDQSARSTDVWPLLTQYLEVCESLLLKNGLEGERASAENLERTIALIDRPLLEKLQSKYYAGLGERVRFFADVRLMFVYGALGEMDRAMEHLGRVSGGGDAGAMATDKDQLSQKQSSSTPYLVYRRLIQVGRLRKNHDLVIKSWEQLRATHKRRDDFAFSGLAFDAAEAYAAVGRADEMIKVLEAEEGAQAKQRMLKPGFYERAVAVVEAACANADENAAHVPALQAVLDKYRAELAALKGAADKRESKASSKPTAGRQNSYGVTVAIMEAFDAGDSERTVAAIRDHFASGRRLPYTVSNQIATFFESKQCAEGLELLVSDVNPDPSAGALRLGLMHYVEEKKVPEAWALFGKVQPLLEKEKRFPGMPFFSKLVQLFSTTGNQAWSESVIDVLEKSAAYDTRKPQFGYANTAYQSLFQGLVPLADINRSLAFYERMIQPTNPLQLVPALSTYHFLMLTGVAAWNMEAIETIYGKLRAQTIEAANQVTTDDTSSMETTSKRMPTNHKERHATFQEALERAYANTRKEKTGRTSTIAYPVRTVADITLPPHLRATRVTENILMLARIVNDQPERALDALKESLVVYPAGVVAKPEENTFRMVAMACLKKMGDVRFNDRPVYTVLGRELQENWSDHGAEKEVTAENVDELFAMAEEHVANWKATTEGASGEGVASSASA